MYGDSTCSMDEVRDELRGNGVEVNIPVNPGNGRKDILYDVKGYGG